MAPARSEPTDIRTTRARQPVDGLAALRGLAPAITPAFWGLIRTPPEKRDHAAIAASQEKTTDAMRILDAQLAKTAFVAGDAFSMGDIPVGVMAYRFRKLVPDRPKLANLERWYAQLEKPQGVPGAHPGDPVRVSALHPPRLRGRWRPRP